MGRKVRPEVRELWEGHPEGPGVVERAFTRSGSGREAITEVQE